MKSWSWAINKRLCLNKLYEMYTDVYCNKYMNKNRTFAHRVC